MGDDWFFLTNNWDLVDISHQLPYRYSPRFGYIKNKLPVNNMLYVSDMLITNSGRHAGIFSITQKPIYYLEHLPNSFGTYIERFYPSMFLKNIDEVLDIDLKNTTLSEDQKNFCHEFSYAPTENPFEAIKTIFQ